MSDKYLTDHSGILKKLLPSDVVLVDRGFDIAESVGMMQAKLRIPALTRGKQQLTALEVEDTSSIANVRIHVERVANWFYSTEVFHIAKYPTYKFCNQESR